MAGAFACPVEPPHCSGGTAASFHSIFTEKERDRHRRETNAISLNWFCDTRTNEKEEEIS
jgi:hypothetical protein